MNITFTTATTTADAISNSNYFPLLWCSIIGIVCFLHVRFETALKETKDMIYHLKLRQTGFATDLQSLTNLATRQQKELERINRLESELGFTDKLIDEVTATMEHVKEKVDQCNADLNNIHGGHFIGTLTAILDEIVETCIDENYKMHNHLIGFPSAFKNRVSQIQLLRNIRYNVRATCEEKALYKIFDLSINIENDYVLTKCIECHNYKVAQVGAWMYALPSKELLF